MHNRVYIATFSEHAAATARRYGFGLEINDFCISENLDSRRMEAALKAVRAELEEAGAAQAIFHGPFTEIIPASIDHRAAELGMERLQQAYEAASLLGINRMVVHSGYIPLLYFKEWHQERSVLFWKEYLRDKPGDFHLYIENVFEDEPLMMKRLIEGIDDDRVQICMDIGHANAMTSDDYDVTSWIRAAGPYIGHFHLHNNDGRSDQHNSLTKGTMDINAVFDAIDTYCDKAVTMTIESRSSEESARWIMERMGIKQIRQISALHLQST